ncbi:hypothetical protein [Novosphingopyxis sp.]|uniref:hypothetical protein n=1 Tax=Novosphingopyxis sp. TaxID=2709690 RepID=UPI003B5BA4C8
MSRGLKRMQGLGWVALVFLVAISLYPLSLNVGAMHAKLVRVDSQIVQTHKEISYLQAELRARASLDQLEKWNDLLYGYDAPRPSQYLGSERALADLQGDDLGPQMPVMVSASYGLNTAPMGTIGNGGRMRSAEDKAPGDAKATQVAARDTDEASAKAPKPGAASIASASASNGTPSVARTVAHEQRVAKLESSLLGPSALRDIQLRAAAERARQ